MTVKNVRNALTFRPSIIFAPNMRAAVIFFLCICFFLVSGRGYADFHHRRGHYSSIKGTGDTKPTILANSDHQQPIISNNNGPSEKSQVFVSFEDEDEDHVFDGKYVLLAGYSIVLASTSVLADLYNYFKNRLPFYKHLSNTASYKYILQRALRL